MKIVFFGSPATALPSLEALLGAGHEIPLVVTQPDKPAGRGKKLRAPAVKEFSELAGIPVFQTPRIRKDPRALPLLQSLRPDLHVVVAFGQIIPADIFNLPGLRSINIHFSMLPAYRGASPVQWAVLKGETATGITIFMLNERMDEGDILSQKEVAIQPGETAAALEDRMARIGADILISTVSEIEILLPGKPQDHSLATYAPLIKKEDGRVDWSKPAEYVERMLRAFMPWPSAFTFLKDRRLKLIAVTPLPHSHCPADAGKVLAVDKEGIRVCCSDGSVLLITRLQPENRRPMSARDFALGALLQPGDHFS
jgi:methionyl-tRNA formyltransferase